MNKQELYRELKLILGNQDLKVDEVWMNMKKKHIQKAVEVGADLQVQIIEDMNTVTTQSVYDIIHEEYEMVSKNLKKLRHCVEFYEFRHLN